MRHEPLREYLTNPHDFDGWLKANVFIGSIVAVAILTMAVAALYWGVGQTGSNFRVSVGRRAVRTDTICCRRRLRSSRHQSHGTRPHGL